MNILKNYYNGAKFSVRSWRLTTLLYLTQLILVLLIVLPFYGSLKVNLGNSMALNGFTDTFSYTSLSEFLDAYSGSGVPLIRFILWTMVLFMIVQVFFKGGILSLAHDDFARFSMKTFLGGCSDWFTRFLGTGLLVVLAQLLVSALVWIPFFLLLDFRFGHAESETAIYRTLLTGGILHFVLASLVYLAGDYTRYFLFLAGKGNIFRSGWKATQIVFRNLYLVYPLFLVLLLNGLALAALYVLLRGILHAGAGWSIGLLFLLQQVFIWTGNLLRIWTISSQFFLMRDFRMHQPS